MHAHTEVRGQLWVLLQRFVTGLGLADRLGWMARDPQRVINVHLSSAWMTGMCYQAWIF